MKRIEQHWYTPSLWLMALLAPLEGLFALVSAIRRMAYARGWLRVHRLPVPVVVVGNINVGGVGKTPLALQLIGRFQQMGIAVGVVSRGYGGSHVQPTLVTPQSTADEVGDEPLLLAASGVPIVVGRDRVAAAESLLQQFPDIQLLLTDDGLQHYRLGRTLEIVVMDGQRGVGNGHLLPNGPLREPLGRLQSVGAIVINGEVSPSLIPLLPARVQRCEMSLVPARPYLLAKPDTTSDIATFRHKRIIAMAGIGHPERFFHTLRSLGLAEFETRSFDDHHEFQLQDLPDESMVDAIFVTSKDAVKLRRFNHAKLWVLPVEAEVSPDLADWIVSRLKMERHGR